MSAFISSSRSQESAAPAADIGIDHVWRRLSHAQVLRLRALGVIGVLAVAALPWVGSRWPESGWVNQGLEWLGLVLILLAILGRCACMLYMGGRKGADLVAEGPYSICRNPLYVFSTLGIMGIGLQTGSLVVGGVLALAAFAVFRWIVEEEEQLLRTAFGPRFDAYCARVPRFWLRPGVWRSPRRIVVDLRGMWRTLRDALPYFLALPLFELIETAQQEGWVHVRIWLP